MSNDDGFDYNNRQIYKNREDLWIYVDNMDELRSSQQNEKQHNF